MKNLFLSFIIIFFIGCGGAAPEYSIDVPTDSAPTIIRIDPSTGAAGTQVTVFGFGFSYTAENNIIMMGGGEATASVYNILENPVNSEIESIVFTVPENLAAGEYALTIIVNDNISNSNFTFTVTGS